MLGRMRSHHVTCHFYWVYATSTNAFTLRVPWGCSFDPVPTEKKMYQRTLISMGRYLDYVNSFSSCSLSCVESSFTIMIKMGLVVVDCLALQSLYYYYSDSNYLFRFIVIKILNGWYLARKLL